MKVFTSSKYSFLYIKNYRNIKYSYRIYCFSKKILTNPILLLSTTCVNIVFRKISAFLLFVSSITESVSTEYNVLSIR